MKNVLHYVKITEQLLFEIRFPKNGPTCKRKASGEYTAPNSCGDWNSPVE